LGEGKKRSSGQRQGGSRKVKLKKTGGLTHATLKESVGSQEGRRIKDPKRNNDLRGSSEKIKGKTGRNKTGLGRETSGFETE